MSEILSLEKSCIQKTVELIKDDYWSSNPFVSCPVQVVQKLVEEVLDSSHFAGCIEIKYLYPLLTSSRVRDLVIKDVQLNYDALEDIFKIMLPYCENIESIQLVNCQINPLEHNGNEHTFYCQTNSLERNGNERTYHTLEKLMLQSKNLKCIESSVYFDLNIIRNIGGLHTLILHFLIPESVRKCIWAESLEMIPKNSIHHFEVSEEETSEICFAISKIALQHFENLTNTNCCLAKAFESLHLEDFQENKIISTEYKLKHCTLGKSYKDGVSFASRDAIHIASVTCPNLISLTILADDPDGLEILNNFHKLEELEIKYSCLENISVINGMLQKATFSKNLKSLSIGNVINFDFSVIMSLCPFLQTLKLDFCEGNNSKDFDPKAFCCLRNLELIVVSETVIERSLLLKMLSFAFQLKSLKLSGIPSFDDRMFQQVLRVNPLNYLSTLHLTNTGATKNGILRFRYMLHIESFNCSTGGQLLFKCALPRYYF